MAEPVKWYKAGMTGCPVLADNTQGSLIILLKALLVDGFNTQTATSLTHSANTITAVFPTAHGYIDAQIVEITGADQAEYNGEFRIEVVDSNTFTYQVAIAPGVSPATTATQIDVKTAPLGWTLLEDNTLGTMAFRRGGAGATGYDIVIDDQNEYRSSTSSQGPIARIEVTNDFLSLGSYSAYYTGYWPAGTRWASEDWFFVGDPWLFYWVNHYGAGDEYAAFAFGDINSLRADDIHHCIVNTIITGTNAYWSSASTSYYPYSPLFDYRNTTYKSIMANYDQGATGGEAWYPQGAGVEFYAAWDASDPYPDPATNQHLFSTMPVWVYDNDPRMRRGSLPGIIQQWTYSNSHHGLMTKGVPGFGDDPIFFFETVNSHQATGLSYSTAFRLANWR